MIFKKNKEPKVKATEKTAEQIEIDNLKEDYDNVINLFTSVQSISNYLSLYEKAGDKENPEYASLLTKFYEVFTKFKKEKLKLKNSIKRFNNIYGHLPLTGVETAILNFLSYQGSGNVSFDKCMEENDIRSID